MITKLALALLVAQGVWARPVPTSNARNAALAAKLAGRVPSYSVSTKDVLSALIRVANDFQIPMGVEWVYRGSNPVAVHLRWKGASVEEIIERVVRLWPGYQVRTAGGVLHIEALGLVPRGENFLNLRVARFTAEGEVPELASRRLHELASAMVAPRRPSSGRLGGGIGRSQGVEVGEHRISIRLSNVTVRHVLDAIANASPFKVWVVTFASAGNLLPTGFRRTVSPTTGEATPDPNQPQWELLQWGRAPY